MNACLDALLSHHLLRHVPDTAALSGAAQSAEFTPCNEWLPGGGWSTQGLIGDLGEQAAGDGLGEARRLLSPLLAKLFFGTARKETSDALAGIAPIKSLHRLQRADEDFIAVCRCVPFTIAPNLCLLCCGLRCTRSSAT